MLSRSLLRCSSSKVAASIRRTARFQARSFANTESGRPFELVKLTIAQYPNSKYNFMLDRYMAFSATRLAPEGSPVDIEILEDPTILGGFRATCMMRSISATDKEILEGAFKSLNSKELLPTPTPTTKTIEETREIVEKLLQQLSSDVDAELAKMKEADKSVVRSLIEQDNQLQKEMDKLAAGSAKKTAAV